MRASCIPYAQAKRFEKPRPVPDWHSPYKANRWSPACPQPRLPVLEDALGRITDRLIQDERCQYLSITLPADAEPDERLPVMVCIHGGAYFVGAGDPPIADPALLVAEQRVIVVAVTYRLGLLGYLGDGSKRPANLGLLDQIAALHWVKRNIAAFGGDPDNVTAFGQSAGADAVLHIMATPGAHALIRRAIAQSPPLGIREGRQAMHAAMLEVAHRVDASTPIEELIALQLEADAVARRFGLAGHMPFGTQYGFDPLPHEHEIGAAWDMAAPRIALMIGHTTEEARLFLPRLAPFSRLAGLALVGPAIRRAVVGALTARAYARPIRRFARRYARAGGNTYLYTIDWAAPESGFGAAHAIDLPLLLGTREAWQQAAVLRGVRWEQVQQAGSAVRACWADFARGRDLGSWRRIPGTLTLRRQPA